MKGMDAAGVLPAFTGTAVHDAWAPYDTYTGATHALCNAHAPRELVYVVDTAPAPVTALATQAIESLVGVKDLLAQTTAAATGPARQVDWPASQTASTSRRGCRARRWCWARTPPPAGPQSFRPGTTPWVRYQI